MEETVRKGYALYDSNEVTSWKRQNYTDSGKIIGCQGLVKVDGKGCLGGAQGFFRTMKLFWMIL